jgi:hypothetical protein
MADFTIPRCAPRFRSLARQACRLPWICGLPCLLLGTLLALAQATVAQTPPFVFAPSTLQLAARATSGNAIFVLTATPVTGVDVLEITDAGIPGSSSVRVSFHVGAPYQGSKNTSWLVRAHAEKVPPGINQSRQAAVKLGQEVAFVPYTLTNLEASFRWTLQQPPATWSLAIGREIPFSIAVGPVRATGVHLASCGLVEKTNGTPLDCRHLKLCKASSPDDCSHAPDLEAQAVHPLVLRVGDDFQEAGSYSGTVTIGANEIVEGAVLASTQMTVNSTTAEKRLAGVLVILLGISAAFVVTVYRRNKMLRDQALIPAALLGQKLKDLAAVLAQSPIQPDVWRPEKTAERIHDSLASLDPNSLAAMNYIPASFPNPAVTVDTGGYQAFLQGVTDSIAVLTAIVQEGFQVLWPHWEAGSSGEDEIKSVLENIDRLAAINGLPLSEVRSRIQAFLAQANTLRAKVALFSAPQPDLKQPPSLAVVNLDMNRLNLYGWVAWLLLTLVAGSVALILTNPAFGTITDYVQCFLWSFGLAAVGQLTTLSFGSVSNALGISLLKP